MSYPVGTRVYLRKFLDMSADAIEFYRGMEGMVIGTQQGVVHPEKEFIRVGWNGTVVNCEPSHIRECRPGPFLLNLGANDLQIPGFRTVDIDDQHSPDFLCDLNKPWPWLDASVDGILAMDVFEHLDSVKHTLNEVWRVLKPGGKCQIQVPNAAAGDGGFCDHTHRSFWTPSTFEYWTKGDAHRERFRGSGYYGVKADFELLDLDVNGHIRQVRHERRYGGYVMEMQVVLRKV